MSSTLLRHKTPSECMSKCVGCEKKVNILYQQNYIKINQQNISTFIYKELLLIQVLSKHRMGTFRLGVKVNYEPTLYRHIIPSDRRTVQSFIYYRVCL